MSFQFHAGRKHGRPSHINYSFAMENSRYFLQCSGSPFWPNLIELLSDDFDLAFVLTDDRIASDFPEILYDEILLGNDLKYGLFDREKCSPLPPHLKESAAFRKRLTEALYSFERASVGGVVSFPDRLQILSSLADFFWAYFEQYQPTFGIATEAPHTFPDIILHGIAEACMIPILHFQQNSIAPTVRPVLGPNYQRINLSQVLDPIVDRRRLENLEVHKSHFDDFFQKASSGEMTQLETDWQARERSTFSGIKSAWRRFYVPFAWLRSERSQMESYCQRSSISEVDSSTPTHPIVRSQSRIRVGIASATLAIQQARLLESLRSELRERSKEHLPTEFAAMFLHFEPEKTSVPDGGVFGDQLAAVRAISQALGGRMPLVVCEHPSQTTLLLRGFRVRRARFYEEISRVPNTWLLSPSVPRVDVLERMRLGFTLQGSIGLELVDRNIPVVALGYPWYTPLEGVFAYDGTWPLNALVDRALKWKGLGGRKVSERLWETLREDSFSALLNPSFARVFPESETDLETLALLVRSIFSRSSNSTLSLHPRVESR